MDAGLEHVDADASRVAGLTVIAAALGAGAGLMLGGTWGAGAGLLFVGAGANGYRAKKWWSSPEPFRDEAVVSATFALFEVVLGGYFAYKAHESRKAARR